MKRFGFPLERVLRYRQLQAEAEQARLEQGLAELARLDSHLQQLDREGLRTEEAVRQSLAAESEIHSAHLVGYPDYRSVLSRSRQGLLDDRRRAVAEVDRQRGAVIEARRSCEILARGRERTLSQWREDFARELEINAGELFLNKWKKPR